MGTFRMLRCPNCHEPTDGLMAEQRQTAVQTYQVWIDHHGTSCLEPVDHAVGGSVGPVTLACTQCGHRWDTSRQFVVRSRP